MSRLVVVLPLVPLRVGDSFLVPDWPPHITVLPPFLTGASAAEIAHVIAAAAAGRDTLTVTAGLDELFGRRADIPVTVMVENEALTGLHRTLVAKVRPFATSPDEPAFTGPGFRAHVTIKPSGRVHEGDELVLTQIALVDMAPRANPGGRMVLATLPLLPPQISG
ncbi:2'-5' RNA ligase family protein [Cryobacterium sp. PH31-AA6]|uniref:2'-5' RNA ligase family protein n=1 Tax=Cryobacterium sp. PH31-AA6 TaxID=3046205 RepID=UPI0024B983F4|nr:2'-5' RNA ligase family protein [Cryobacterium sp. PH31-AA6]MDJ0322958.1 2'-5' RNA ligase family protein [Cryobacterium sp. PH31-AA6]